MITSHSSQKELLEEALRFLKEKRKTIAGLGYLEILIKIY